VKPNSILVLALALAACMPAPPPIVTQECLAPLSQTLTDAELIARAKAIAREGEETPSETADCCSITWMETSLDETQGEWSEYSARRHRIAREAGLQRYAIVSVRARDILNTDQDRWFWLDACGNPVR